MTLQIVGVAVILLCMLIETMILILINLFKIGAFLYSKLKNKKKEKIGKNTIVANKETKTIKRGGLIPLVWINNLDDNQHVQDVEEKNDNFGENDQM